MSPFLSKALACAALFFSSFDAAVETFLVEPQHIKPESLQNIIGIVSIQFSELNYAAGMDAPPAEIQTYDDAKSYFDEQKVVLPPLTVRNTKAISGIDYSQLILRRFPVTGKQDNLLEIVYDAERNLRTWIQIVDGNYVRTNVGQLVPAEVLMFEVQPAEYSTFDIFFLLHGKPRSFYETPHDTSRQVKINNDTFLNRIPWWKGKGPVSSFEILEFKDGFAKVYSREGADGELVFAGWVKIFEENRLSIWQFATGGC